MIKLIDECFSNDKQEDEESSNLVGPSFESLASFFDARGVVGKKTFEMFKAHAQPIWTFDAPCFRKKEYGPLQSKTQTDFSR